MRSSRYKRQAFVFICQIVIPRNRASVLIRRENQNHKKAFSFLSEINPVRDDIGHNAAYLTLTSLIGSSAGLGFWWICARLFSIEEVGVASSYIAILGIFGVAATIGLPQMINRFIGERDDKESLANRALFLSAITGLAIGLIVGLLSLGLIEFKYLLVVNGVGLVLFPFYVGSQAFNTVLDSVFVGLQKPRKVFERNLVFNSSKIALLFVVAGSGAVGILVSWGAALILSSIIALVFMLPKVIPGYRITKSPRGTVTRQLLHFSIASYFETLFLVSSLLILPPIAMFFIGSNSAASLYVCVAIVNLIAMIPDSAVRTFVASNSGFSSPKRRSLQSALIFSLILTVFAVLIVLLLSSTILSFFGPEYANLGKNALVILALGALPLSVNFQYLGVFRVTKNIRKIVAISGSIFVLSAILSISLSSLYSLEGVALGWTLSQFIVFLIVTPAFLMRYHSI